MDPGIDFDTCDLFRLARANDTEAINSGPQEHALAKARIEDPSAGRDDGESEQEPSDERIGVVRAPRLLGLRLQRLLD